MKRGDGDERNEEKMRIIEDEFKIKGLKGKGNRKNEVLKENNEEIEVIGLKRVKKKGRGESRGKGGGKIGEDMEDIEEEGEEEKKNGGENKIKRLEKREGKEVVKRILKRKKERIIGIYSEKRRSDGRLRIRKFMGDIKILNGEES